MSDVLTQKVLVLNKVYSPITVTSVRDAVVKVFCSIAEIITVEDGTYCNYDFTSWSEISALKKELEGLDEHEDVLYTPRLILVVPRIIRLLAYDRVPSHDVKLTRRNIYARDLNTCQYCGKHFAVENLNIDHVVPKSQGGSNTWDNLVCACCNCNTKKGGKTPKQAHMKLIRKPARPKHNPVMRIHIGHKRYESWKNFVSEVYWTVPISDE